MYVGTIAKEICYGSFGKKTKGELVCGDIEREEEKERKLEWDIPMMVVDIFHVSFVLMIFVIFFFISLLFSSVGFRLAKSDHILFIY